LCFGYKAINEENLKGINNIKIQKKNSKKKQTKLTEEQTITPQNTTHSILE